MNKYPSRETDLSSQKTAKSAELTMLNQRAPGGVLGPKLLAYLRGHLEFHAALIVCFLRGSQIKVG